jgi:hypothetical protein
MPKNARAGDAVMDTRESNTYLYNGYVSDLYLLVSRLEAVWKSVRDLVIQHRQPGIAPLPIAAPPSKYISL